MPRPDRAGPASAAAAGLLARPLRAVGLLLGLVVLAAAATMSAPTHSQDHNDRPGRYAATALLPMDPVVHGLVRVPLSLPLLRALRSPTYSDLRVFNGDGESLPYAWSGAPAVAPGTGERTPLPHFRWPGADTASPAGDADVVVELSEAGRILRVLQRGAPRAGQPAQGRGAARQWLIDLPPAAAKPAALWLHWDTGTGSTAAAVRAEASADARRWRPVGEATVLAMDDAATGQSLVQRRIALAPLADADRYLRLQLAPALSLVRVEAEAPLPPAAAPLTSERFALQRAGPRLWTLDTGAVLPVVQVQLHATQDNTLLPLRITHRRAGADAAAEPWTGATAHTAYRLRRDGVLVESPVLALAAGPARAWRFELDDRVGPPQAGLEVTLWWTTPQLVVAARGPPPFRLALGRESAPAVAIERATLMPAYREGDEFALPEVVPAGLVMLTPGTPTLRERLTDAGPEARRRWLLWAVLALAVAVLAGLAWRLGRNLDAPPAG